MSTQIATKVDAILEPLQLFSTQVFGSAENPSIGGQFTSDENHPTITHAEYVKCKVLPRLRKATKRYGVRRVAEELVNITLPAYRHIKADNMAAFWDDTIAGIPDDVSDEQDKYRRKNHDRMNASLAAEFGVQEIYSPIIDLALVHQQSGLFSVSKFFYGHACRMGHIIKTFGYSNWLAYLYLAKKLLLHGVYDWSLEQSPEEWEALKPAIDKYGFSAVLRPFVNMKAAIGHVEGAKHYKYKYSLLDHTVTALIPYIIERIMTDGPAAVYEVLQPIVAYVDKLHEKGGFTLGRIYIRQKEFFNSFSRYLPRIREEGTARIMRSVETHWTAQLLSSET